MSFEVSWEKKNTREQRRPETETYGIDDAFADYKTDFSTTVEPLEIQKPKEIPPINNIADTAAAQIFGQYCQSKFGFTPSFKQK